MHGRRLPLVGCAALAGVLAVSTVLATDSGTVRLSLDACRKLALENNLDLISARQDPRIAEQRVEASKAPFDGVLSAGATYNDSDGEEDIADNAAATSTTGESQSEAWNGDVSLSHLLKFGANYSLTYNLNDVDASATSVQATTGFITQSVFQQQTDGFTLRWEMPLLNGLGTEVNTVEVLLAQGNLDISHEDLRLQAMRTLQAVEDAYWDVVAAREGLRISRLALDRAEDLLDLNRKKVEVGTLAPIEITEADAGVAAQVEAVIVAETTLENSEDLLLQVLAVPADDPLWSQAIDTIDRPSFEPVEIDLDAALAVALAERPELLSARRKLRNDELSERVAKHNLRHGLDLTASLTPDRQEDVDRAFATLQPPGFPPSDTTTKSEDTNWELGLRYRYSLHNRQSKTNYAIAQHTTQKSDIALRNSEQSVRVDVRTAARNVQSGFQRIQAATKNVELQREKLVAEQKKFDNGMSTSFEVLTFQNDLADAELAEIRAALDYVKALTAFELAKGTLLDARGLSLGP